MTLIFEASSEGIIPDTMDNDKENRNIIPIKKPSTFKAMYGNPIVAVTKPTMPLTAKYPITRESKADITPI